MTDRDLVRLYWPVGLRPAFDALFAIDDALGEVVARAAEPALAAIKLAWWRERLQELDEGKASAEPRLQAAARELLARGISGADLSRLEEYWALLLYADDDRTMDKVAERGAVFFRMASSLLWVANERTDQAGEIWGLASAARRSSDWPARTHLFLHAEEALRGFGRYRFDNRLRPLTALAALAARDVRRGEFNIEPEGTPGRALALLRHRLTGRIA